MAEDLISSYIDRDGVKGDTKFLLDEINKAFSAIKEFNSVKPAFDSAKGYEAIASAVKKQREQQEELTKSSVKINEAQNRTAQSLKESIASINSAATAAGKLSASYDELIKFSVQNQIATKALAGARKELDVAFKDGLISSQEYAANLEEIKKKEVEITVSNLDLNRALRNTEKGYQSAGGSINELRSQLNLALQTFDRLDEVDRGSEIGQGLKKNIQELTAKISEQEQATGRFQRNVGNYSGAVKTLEKALGDVRAKLDDYNKSGKVSADVLESLTREEGLLSQLVNAQVNGFASATQEVRNNEKALQALQNAGLQTTKYYETLLQETAALKDNVNDLKTEIKNLGSDTRTFDGLVQGAQTLAGVYGIAEGAAALFGEENEDLQKTFVKLQAVQTILNGLQAIQNALQKESSVMLLINSVRTGALAVATKAYAFATGGATAAARAFNTALLATGIGAALVLIGAIASAMSSLGDETDETTKSTKELADEMERLNAELEKTAKSAEIRRNSMKGGLDDMRRELQLQEAAGASDGKRFELKKRIMDAELQNLKTLRYTVEENSDRAIELDKEIADKKVEIHAAQLAFDKKASDDAKKLAKERSEKSLEYAEKERRARLEIFKLEQEDRIKQQKTIAEADIPNSTLRIRARLEQFEEERKLADAQKEYELTSQELTSSERELIIEKHLKAVKALEQSAANDIIKIRKSINDGVKEQAEQDEAAIKADQDAKLQSRLDDITAGFEREIQGIEDGKNAKLQALNEEYVAGTIDKQKYEDEKLKIENTALARSLESQLAYYRALVELYEFDEQKKADALSKIAVIQKSLSDIKVGIKDKETDETLKNAEKMKAALANLREEVKGLAFDLITGSIEAEKNAIQDQIDALEAKKQKDIEVANQSIQNAQDRAAAIAIIEARAGAEKERLEKRKRQLDQERARFERIKNIADIIQSTAVAVVSTLGAKPWTPANIALAAVVGAIGAAQVARVLATPIPKFYGGKSESNKYEGMAVVGDGGRSELILREDGTMEKTPNKPTLTYVKRNDIIFPDARQLEEERFNMAISNTGKLVTERPKQYRHSNHDVVQGLKSLERTVKNKKEVVIKGVSKRDLLMKGGYDAWRYLG
jgi:hypothetical protein